MSLLTKFVLVLSLAGLVEAVAHDSCALLLLASILMSCLIMCWILTRLANHIVEWLETVEMRYELWCISRATGAERIALSGRYIARWGTQHEQSQSQRSSFRDTLMTATRATSNHTHGSSAAARTSGSRTCANVAKMMGKTPYYYQKSFSDEKQRYAGSRTWVWSKDLHIPLSDDKFTDDHVLIMVDVDYYLDMPSVLAKSTSPILLYTFQPAAPAAERRDYSYTCNQNVFTYVVNGGGQYVHGIWQYGNDSFVAKMRQRDGSWRHVAYAIERRQVDEDHQMVALIPVRTWHTPYDIDLVQSPVLTRLSVSDGEFNVMRAQSNAGMQLSLSAAGEQLSVTVSLAELDGLRHISEGTSIGLTLAGVQRAFPDVSFGQSALLLRYVKANTTLVPPIVFPVEHASRGYSCSLSDHDDEAKCAVQAFMSPFLHEAFNPLMHAGNERTSIKERITDIKSDACLTPQMDVFMDEFVALVFPEPGVLVPTDDDEVYRRQPRPSQQSILRRAGVEVKDRIESFLKREAYGEPKPPRTISTYNPTIKLNYSRYMYPLSDHVIETCPWYAFGRTPARIAEQVSDICGKAGYVLSTDLSRFDGRVSPACRAFEVRLMKRGLHPKFFGEFKALHDKQYNLVGYGKFGTRYDTGTTRGSGSGETAIMNSQLNALMAYCAIRKAHPSLTPAESYAMLGIYGGDDGLTRDVPEQLYVDVCKEWGHKLTPERFVRGSHGVNFLARIYSPYVWFGDQSSMCDVRRMMAKIHTTVALPPGVTPLQKLIEKCRSLDASDRNTPVVGDLAAAVLRLGALPQAAIKDDDRKQLWNYVNWEARLLERRHQYPNVDTHSWMLDTINIQMADVDLDIFYAFIERVTQMPPHQAHAAILRPPLMARVDHVAIPNGYVADGMCYRTPPQAGRKPMSPRGTRSTREEPGRKPMLAPRVKAGSEPGRKPMSDTSAHRPSAGRRTNSPQRHSTGQPARPRR